MKALCVALAALMAGPALANDTTAELKPGGLIYTRSGDITMAEENLYISPKQVRVDYVFRNQTDAEIENLVAFPMPEIGGNPFENVDNGDYENDNFLRFTVEQDGVAIKPDLQQRAIALGIDVTDRLIAADIPLNPLRDGTSKALEKLDPETQAQFVRDGLIFVDTYDDGAGMKGHLTPLWRLRTVYYWNAIFPPGRDIRVTHSYQPSIGGTVGVSFLEDGEAEGARFAEYKQKYCIDNAFVKLAQKSLEPSEDGTMAFYENWISYVLTTGANWSGPIGKFKLTVDKGEVDNFVSFCGEGVKKTGPTTFEMTKTDFTPERDIDILLLVPAQAP